MKSIEKSNLKGHLSRDPDNFISNKQLKQGSLINIVSRNSPVSNLKSQGMSKDPARDTIIQTLQPDMAPASSNTYLDDPGKRVSSYIQSANALEKSIN